MRDEIYWVLRVSVNAGQFERFHHVADSLCDATRAEPGSIAYDYTVSGDGSVVHVFESYRDSAAVAAHVTETFGPVADEFTACVTVQEMVVYGRPDDRARELLAGFEPSYLTSFAGYTAGEK